MSKVKRFQLEIENDYNYNIIGICSHFQDYHLVWGINERLKFKLAKAKELFLVSTKKGETSEFPYYYSKLEDKHLDVYFIKNKHEGNLLIPEKQQMDYFLFLCNNFAIDLNQCIEELRKIPSVLLCYSFDAKSLHSTENIIFE